MSRNKIFHNKIWVIRLQCLPILIDRVRSTEHKLCVTLFSACNESGKKVTKRDLAFHQIIAMQKVNQKSQIRSCEKKRV